MTTLHTAPVFDVYADGSLVGYGLRPEAAMLAIASWMRRGCVVEFRERVSSWVTETG